ncbi:hypothetical protein Pars_1637 [Pyrobaculum arsenaticum DSM 13514]|uniref:Uncharacterized protein n=2 Tax=Thermoproteaceae TaxID=2267 RepID=A4WLC3_PYRAR|nr:hypothetical protein Pars_1637 [Pyrobaculum arsenaticum DSM 13514]
MIDVIEILKIVLQAYDLFKDVYRRLTRRHGKKQPIGYLIEQAKRGKCLSQNDNFHVRGEVLEVYKAVEPLLDSVRNKCVYAAMYLYLIYARLVGGFECKAALEKIREKIPRGCLNGLNSAECIIANYLLTNKVTREMKLLARLTNIYGKIAKYMLGGVLPQECAEDLKELIEKMPERHRLSLNVPPIREGVKDFAKFA